MITVFGIRHHGPGSSLSLLESLSDYQPDCVLVEAPAEANTQLSFLANKEIEPPIALLVYDEKNPEKAAYLPFANFSPEWQAFQYSIQNDIRIHCIDLPMSNQMALSDQDDLLSANANEAAIAKDPLGYLAHLRGYQDSEQWWNDTFEESQRGATIFPAIIQLISTIRKETNRTESRETLIREAYMRKQIRTFMKEGYQRIAVVCGAWHAPILENTLQYKMNADNKILRGLPKIKVKATWIPWSYERLSKLSGYGAGVLSPAWYELLFSFPDTPETTWMSKASILLRKEGFASSPAHSTEAIRLAQTLATMRDKRIPGLSELEEAALVVFCNGEKTRMKTIRRQLIIGNKVGSIPPKLTSLPIQKNFLKLIKSTRLTKYWEATGKYWLKANKANPRGGLDLRNANDRLKSHFLHQLNILNVHWGKVMDKSGLEKGSFKEFWQLEWDPLFIIRIIESGKWGNTVYNAALLKTIEEANNSTRLSEVVTLVDNALKAGLEAAIHPLVDKMTDLLAETEDCLILMESLPVFVNILEYGDVRKTDLLAVEHYVSQIVPRICIELPGYCHYLDAEESKKVQTQITRNNTALKILENEAFLSKWEKTLSLLADVEFITPEAKGIASRLLFDQNKSSLETTAKRMSLALSIGNNPPHIARWLDGFLDGSGLLLIHFPPLWNLIDQWISQVPTDAFLPILPLLRRTFAKFSDRERSKMMKLASTPGLQSKTGEEDEQIQRSDDFSPYEQTVIPTMRKILGA